MLILTFTDFTHMLSCNCLTHLSDTIMDNGNGRPPACNLKSGPDGKLKSNLEWP